MERLDSEGISAFSDERIGLRYWGETYRLSTFKMTMISETLKNFRVYTQRPLSATIPGHIWIVQVEHTHATAQAACNQFATANLNPTPCTKVDWATDTQDHNQLYSPTINAISDQSAHLGLLFPRRHKDQAKPDLKSVYDDPVNTEHDGVGRKEGRVGFVDFRCRPPGSTESAFNYPSNPSINVSGLTQPRLHRQSANQIRPNRHQQTQGRGDL